MSLAIDTSNIIRVLLTDGIWYDVVDNSFELDSYEYLTPTGSEDRLALGGGREKLVATYGFVFKSSKVKKSGRAIYIKGPLTSIVAVQEGGYVEGT